VFYNTNYNIPISSSPSVIGGNRPQKHPRKWQANVMNSTPEGAEMIGDCQRLPREWF